MKLAVIRLADGNGPLLKARIGHWYVNLFLKGLSWHVLWTTRDGAHRGWGTKPLWGWPKT